MSNKVRKMLKRLILFLLLGLFLGAQNAQAQISEEEVRISEEETIRELEKAIIPPDVWEKLSLRYGGWFNSRFRDYKNLDNDGCDEDNLSSSLSEDLRLWGMLTYSNKHSLYVRLKNYYIHRSTGDGYTGIADDYEGPALDMAYVDLGFGKSKFKIGRQYLYLGRGIVYAGVHDGVKIDLTSSDFYTKLIFAQTKPDEDNIDMSVPNYEKEGKRYFSGIEVSYLGVPNHAFYLFALAQRDQGDDYPEGETQNYIYDSEYYGLGFEGKRNENLRYWLELIRQTGKSYTDTYYVDLEKKDVDAWALDVGLRYAFDVLTNPYVEIEYAFGSGDEDRTGVTDTEYGGNQYGKDDNFLYFGNFFAGYASFLRLSNLHIWKFDAGFSPFNKTKLGKDITIGSKFFLYRKWHNAGAIYDYDATENNNDIGEEINVYFYWKLNSKVSYSLRYGVFFPGNAYPTTTNNNTKYLSSSLTLKF